MAAGRSYPPVGLTYVAFEGVALLEIAAVRPRQVIYTAA